MSSQVSTVYTPSVDGTVFAPLKVNDTPGVTFTDSGTHKLTIPQNTSLVLPNIWTPNVAGKFRIALIANNPIRLTLVPTNAGLFTAAQALELNANPLTTDLNGFDILLAANSLFDVTFAKAPFSITLRAPASNTIATVNVSILVAGT